MREHEASIASRWLGNERRVWVIEPVNPRPPRPLVVLLDGEIYRERIEAAKYLPPLRDAGDVADAWIVLVSAADPEARWRECPCHPPFAAFLADELLAWLQARYPAIGDAPRRVVAGLSYSGLAAAYVALERPGVFDRVISQSGSFWWNDGRLIRRVQDAAAAVPTAFYLSVGTRETQTNLQHRPDVRQEMSQVDAVRRFRDALAARGHDVTYVEFDGAHEYTAWQKTLPDALRWAIPGPMLTRA